MLAYRVGPTLSHDETILSILGTAVFGRGFLYIVLQAATAAILVLAANTAFTGFPLLGSIIAKDGYLPRQFATRGDRLAYSNGIVGLAAAAAALLVAFGGVTTLLIPLYAVGVFTSFTLSQWGMVQRHRRSREPGWRFGVDRQRHRGGSDPDRPPRGAGVEVHDRGVDPGRDHPAHGARVHRDQAALRPARYPPANSRGLRTHRWSTMWRCSSSTA